MAALNEVQRMLKDQAEAWVTEEAPVSRFRQLRDQGAAGAFDQDAWQSMVELGWTGILVPETYGGSELGYLSFGIVLEQLGRQLVASPLFASAYVGVTAMLLAANEEQKQMYLPGVVDGSTILALAVDEGPRHNPQAMTTSATPVDGGYKLSGNKAFVVEGGTATHLIVAARTGGVKGEGQDISLFIVPCNADGLTRKSLSTVDSRGYANINLDQVYLDSASLLGELDAGYQYLELVLQRACAGLAAEMQGVGSQSFAMLHEYLQTRVQFGKIIGSFQALGHRAADLYSLMELSRSCAEGALQAIDAASGFRKDDSRDSDEALLCTLAKYKTGEFLYLASNELIQMHGGIGMTDEFDAGLYLKRARMLENQFGNRGYHRDRFATLSGI